MTRFLPAFLFILALSCGHGGPRTHERSEQVENAAEASIIKGDLDLALAILDESSDEPTVSGAFLRGDLLDSTGDPVKAADSYLQSLELAHETGHSPDEATAAAMGLVGHNWPAYYRFKGGMGLSAIYGGFLVLDFWGTLITAFVGMFLGVVVLKMVYISYLAGLWLMLPWIWFRTHSFAHLGYVIFTNIIFLIGILPQIQESARRKRAGEDIDFSGAMDITPMGRMISKMAKRAGLLRDKQ